MAGEKIKIVDGFVLPLERYKPVAKYIVMLPELAVVTTNLETAGYRVNQASHLSLLQNNDLGLETSLMDYAAIYLNMWSQNPRERMHDLKMRLKNGEVLGPHITDPTRDEFGIAMWQVPEEGFLLDAMALANSR